MIDIDAEKLKVMHKVAQALKDPTLIISVERDRMKRWWLDYKIPFKYGVKQSMGECVGPVGLAHTLRQVPLILDICPGAFVINYSNPESRVTYAMHRYTKLNAVGLYHGR